MGLIAALLAVALGVAAPVQAPASPAVLPPTLGASRLQTLLQSFVDQTYLKAFRHLGDERDFDHGHLIFASSQAGAAPVAILYHTQELAYYAAAKSGYEWIDRDGRNWIQWLATGRVENARRYLSALPPASLPLNPVELASHHTILAEMLDAGAFGGGRLLSRQVVFSRTSCPAQVDPSAMLRIRLPDAGSVCLALSEY